MNTRRSIPDLPFLALCGCLLVTVLVGQSWLSDQAERIRAEWLDEEKAGLRRILQNTLRLSSSQTCFPELMRRTIADLKSGMPVAESFRRFIPWSHTPFELLVFGPEGRRLQIPGFRHERGAISEKVLRSLRDPSPTSTTAIRKLSASFLGMRTALEKMAQSPGAMVELGGSIRFAYAGWWSLRDELNRTAASTRPGANAEGKVTDVLLLVPRQGFEQNRLLRFSIKRTRRLLRGNARLDLVRRTEQSDRVTSAPFHDRTVHLDVRLACNELLDLRIRRKVFVPAATARLMNVIVSARLTLLLGGLLLLAFGFRLYRPAAAEKLSLGRLIRLGILGCVIPALALFLTWTFDFLTTSSRTMSRQMHRYLEQELERIDRESNRDRQKLDVRLNQLGERLHGTPIDRAVQTAQEELADCPQIESAYLIDPYGVILAVLRRHQNAHEVQRVFALSIAVNMTALLENREPKSICRESYDLTYMKGFTRHLLENLGRTDELAGLGMRRSVFVKMIRGETATARSRFLVVLMNLDDLKKQYVHTCLADRSRTFQLGLAETGLAGPSRGYPDRLLWNPDLISLIEEAYRLRHTVNMRLTLPGRGTFLASAVPGKQLTGYVLLGAVPFKPIERQIRSWLGTAVFTLFGVVLFGAGAAYALASYMRSGLSRLEDGLYRLQNRQFQLTPIDADDQLTSIFNGMVTAGRTFDELYAAAPVQKTLIFERSMRKAGWQIECDFQPGPFLGGDYADVLELPDGRVLFCIGDAGSSSLAAVLLAARVKMAISLLAEDAVSPEHILQQLNELLLTMRVKRRHMSLLIGVASADGQIVLVNAGHCWPLIGSFRDLQWIEERGLPLGTRLRRPVQALKVRLSDEERLICCTNGWVRRFDPELLGLGFERWRQEVKNGLSLNQAPLVRHLDGVSSLLPPPPEGVQGRVLLTVQREKTA